MTELYRGCMRGRTMYVIPFCMGPLDAESPMFGVEITDSAYVVALDADHDADGRRRCCAAMGDDADFVPCLHSVGAPLEPGQADVPWPCNDTKYISPLPRGPGDLVVRLRATAATRCWARSATRCASQR